MKGKIFNAQEVQAILNKSKVMFREVINTKQSFIEPNEPYGKCSYQVGQMIFCKESFSYIQDPEDCAREGEPCEIHYKADYDAEGLDKRDIEAVGIEFLPASRMPQWASRLTLLIKEIKVERLAEISEEDCIKEGVERGIANGEQCGYKDYLVRNLILADAKDSFSSLWNATHKKPEEKFEASPFVFVYQFELTK